jgi:hypothetical protein
LGLADVSKLQDAVSDLIGKPFPEDWTVTYTKDGSTSHWVYKSMTAKERFCTLGFIAIAGIALIGQMK